MLVVTGAPSSNNIGSSKFGHHPQHFRPEPALGLPGGGCFPNNSFPGQNYSASSGPPKNAPQVACHATFAPNTIQKPSLQIQESSTSFAQMSSQPMRTTTQQVCQAPTQTDFSNMHCHSTGKICISCRLYRFMRILWK